MPDPIFKDNYKLWAQTKGSKKLKKYIGGKREEIKKQNKFYQYLKDLKREYLERGSPTWMQTGIMEMIWFLMDKTRENLQCENCSDNAFEVYIRGMIEIMNRIEDWIEE